MKLVSQAIAFVQLLRHMVPIAWTAASDVANSDNDEPFSWYECEVEMRMRPVKPEEMEDW